MWPLPLEFRWPWFEKEIYKRICIPHALNRLWGWHDPTLYPYLMKLSVVHKDNIWYGWEEIFFEMRSLSWDFGIPVMPVYKQVVTKKIISEEEAMERIQVVNKMTENILSNRSI